MSTARQGQNRLSNVAPDRASYVVGLRLLWGKCRIARIVKVADPEVIGVYPPDDEDIDREPFLMRP
jgi:hypothetical protein